MKDRFATFTIHMNQISRNIRLIEDHMMKEFDLRNSHVSCLYFLYIKRNLTTESLCKICGQEKASITKAILHLKTKGFISVDVEDENRKKNILVLTPKGKTVAKKITATINEILGQMDDEISEEERLEFYRCLDIVCRKIADYKKNMD